MWDALLLRLQGRAACAGWRGCSTMRCMSTQNFADCLRDPVVLCLAMHAVVHGEAQRRHADDAVLREFDVTVDPPTRRYVWPDAAAAAAAPEAADAPSAEENWWQNARHFGHTAPAPPWPGVGGDVMDLAARWLDGWVPGCLAVWVGGSVAGSQQVPWMVVGMTLCSAQRPLIGWEWTDWRPSQSPLHLSGSSASVRHARRT